MSSKSLECKKCKNEFSIIHPDTCARCIVSELKNLKSVQKTSWQIFWLEAKRFSYFALLVMPLSGFIGYRYGVKIQWCANLIFIYGMLAPSIVSWLMRKF